MWTLALHLALLAATPFPQEDATATIAHWELDGSLASAVGGASLTAQPPEAATFEEVVLPGASTPTQVLRLAPDGQLRAPIAFTMRGPGYQGRWALVMDVQVAPPEAAKPKKSKKPAWLQVPLLQTDPWNDDDAEMLLDSRHGLEVAGERGGTLDPEAWHRVALIVDEQAGTLTGFIDGVMTRRVKTDIADSRWALEPEILLFADKAKKHPGLRVASLQVRTGLVAESHVQLLGGVSADGLPRPEAPLIAWLTPPPAVLSVGERFSAAFRASPPSGEVAVVMTGVGEAIELGRVPADAGRVTGVIPTSVAAGQHKLELRWSGGETRAASSPVEVRAGGEAQLGVELLGNPGFDGVLDPWQVSGDATVKVVSGANGQALIGNRGDFVARQTVSVPAALRGGGYALSASARVKRKDRATIFGDRGVLRLRFTDEQGAALGELRSLSVDGGDWHTLKIEGPIPTGAHAFVAEVLGWERQGGRNEVAFDQVSVVARPASVGVARLSKAPILMPGNGNQEMTLIFETDFADVAPVVVWELDGQTRRLTALESTTIDPRHQVHRAVLSGLPEGGQVAYRVEVGEVSSPTWRFTVPKTDGRLRMGWLSDNQHGWRTFRTLVPLLEKEDLDSVLIAGDIVQRGHELREWQTEWFSPLSIGNFAQQIPVQVARGNHDANGALAHAYVPLPGNGHWHAYTRNGIRFIVLDSEADAPRVPEQMRWLEAELGSEESRLADFRIVTFHRAPFSNRWDSVKSKYDGEKWVRDSWVPIFAEHKVDLVVAGHAHTYQRRDLDGVRYVVVGGAGGRLDKAKTGKWPMDVDYVGHHYAVMEVADQRLSWVAKDFEGQVIDRWELRSKTRKMGK